MWREKHLFSERKKNISIKIIEILRSKADRIIKHFSLLFIDFEWSSNLLNFVAYLRNIVIIFIKILRTCQGKRRKNKKYCTGLNMKRTKYLMIKNPLTFMKKCRKMYFTSQYKFCEVRISVFFLSVIRIYQLN